MKIKNKKVTVRELVKDYKNDQEEGVSGYGGKLNIRPQYQREFVYNDKKRDAVINTIRKNFPLNVMYWADNGDDTFEVIDGQQRTISICEYVAGNYSIDFQYFHNLEDTEQNQILDYELMVYVCNGNDKDKLDWFKTINIAGEELTDQELRNAVYKGPWVADAKKYFSRTGCPAYDLAKDYVRGTPIRQDFLETAIKWISSGDIDEYMAKHQHKPNASQLWLHFQKVINWVKTTFKNYRKEMKGIDWGPLYEQFKDQELDSAALEKEISQLMQDDDVTKKRGIYSYVLTRDEKYLSIRSFTNNQKREAYEKQQGICPICKELYDNETDPEKKEKIKYEYEIDEMEADHITPWSQGGRTTADNCKMLCKKHNRQKSDK